MIGKKAKAKTSKKLYFISRINKMHLWYDTREGLDHNKYPTVGWMFPCYICQSPTSKYKTMKGTGFGDIDIQCCKNCNIKNVSVYDFDMTYLVMYNDDTPSNR